MQIKEISLSNFTVWGEYVVANEHGPTDGMHLFRVLVEPEVVKVIIGLVAQVETTAHVVQNACHFHARYVLLVNCL